MGRRDRERIERIKAGEEESIADKARKESKLSGTDITRMHSTGCNALQAMRTGDQIKVLSDSLH